ncbi:MAG: hypothetical protein PHC44_03445, partial [Lutispora sp.]|nr:hypothetical protein [Lutispora sp.]
SRSFFVAMPVVARSNVKMSEHAYMMPIIATANVLFFQNNILINKRGNISEKAYSQVEHD